MKLWALLFYLAHRYAVEGVVIETNPAQRQVMVAHRPIADYMPAMTMSFKVERRVALESLTPGTRVRFELEVSKNSSIARDMRILSGAIDPDLPKPSAKKVLIGQKMPSFSLVDQDGKTVQMSDLAGRVVVVDFIYTRCPLPGRLPAPFPRISLPVSKKLRGRGRRVSVDYQYSIRSSILRRCSPNTRGDGRRVRLGGDF